MPEHHARPYAHHSHLPYAHEPLKTLYVFQRLLTTLAMVPYWAIYYLLLPKDYRPRPSWSVRQFINVKFTRRIYKITEVAGVTWGTRDPEAEPSKYSLKETRFEWAEPLPEQLRTGIVIGDVPFKRVGCYVWPKKPPPELEVLEQGDGECNAKPLLIGIFMHGGGYCHMSAHESSRTSRIPRRLIADNIMSEVYSVEYRLLQHASFPAALQDAGAAYTHIVQRFRKRRSEGYKIILIGDSSGGNLVLALTRWLRDEGQLPMPDGLVLLSPSCDVSHALPETPSLYIPRPNAKTDYLTDTPEPRELLQRTFLGFTHCTDLEEESRLMQIAHSEYVSPCSPRVLQEWSHPVNRGLDGTHVGVFPETLSRRLDQMLHLDDPQPVVDSQAPRTFTRLFEVFPKTLIVVGDAERLVTEVKSLQKAMEKDGVDVRAEWVDDAVHDILIIKEGWWDRRAVQKAWGVIKEWAEEFKGNSVELMV